MKHLLAMLQRENWNETKKALKKDFQNFYDAWSITVAYQNIFISIRQELDGGYYANLTGFVTEIQNQPILSI